MAVDDLEQGNLKWDLSVPEVLYRVGWDYPEEIATG
jgi:hypothetical protein